MGIVGFLLHYLTNNRRTKKKDIYVISTAQRPVPLEHYLYAGRAMHKIVDSARKFLGEGSV
jgi:antiviral helicase SKI2